jgi:hypothetical protein
MRAAWIALVFWGLAACAPRVAVEPIPAGARMAVASPIVPRSDAELLAGVLPQAPVQISPEDREILGRSLLEEASKRPQSWIGPRAVTGCAEHVLAHLQGRGSAVRFWQEVGKCANADFVLIPFVLFWEERIGGEWGVERPAHVILDLFLVETNSGAVRRFHFDEEQRGLAENLFLAAKFARRQGRWLSAQELARDGFVQGLRALGL